MNNQTNDLSIHYDMIASQRDKFRAKNKYYYSLLDKQYRYFIPEHKRVLEVGCSTGDLLNFLNPSYGLGIDISSKMVEIARNKYPHLTFYAGDISTIKSDEPFDYIVLSGVLGEVGDIQTFLESIKRYCHKDTRILIEYYSYLWQYILKMGERLKLKIPQKIQNWLTAQDLLNFLNLTGYEPIKQIKATIMPIYIWGVSFLVNKYMAQLPIINAFTLNHFIIARLPFNSNQEFSVSIIIPCRNEIGNIEAVITRMPMFGLRQEFIFVEGGSQDGTYEEIDRIIKKFPQKDIKLYKQSGKGKGDAVRLGFNKAQGDILMILDADLTVSPEDLPKFYKAIRENKGEFINGSRLVYPMESEAMRFLNLMANKFFAILFSWLLGQPLKDTLCGTKVIFRHQYEELVANRFYFGDFDPFGDFDLIFGVSKLNLKIVELPIKYKNRQYGTTQIQRFRHGLLLFRMCLFAMKKIKFI